MLQLIDPNVMRECESRYFAESGVRAIDVMERAAQALAEVIRARVPKGKRIYFACGSGGNGGDGYACARLLCEEYRCEIVALKKPQNPDARTNQTRAMLAGLKVYTFEESQALPAPDAWVDALFGTGFAFSPRGDAASMIERINRDARNGSAVFSADLPSGLNGTTGRASAVCVRADATVSFGWFKRGQVLNDGMDCCGERIIADVGFPTQAFQPMEANLLCEADVKALLPARKRNVHKGSCGNLLIVAGSFGMAGAACMCAMAALRSGCGVVSVACPRSIVPILQIRVPQAVCIPLEEEDGAISEAALPRLEQALKGKTAVVIGCGLSRDASPEILRAVLKRELPTVVDADALNIISEHLKIADLLKECHVITPHPGEAARLLKAKQIEEVQDDPMNTAKALLTLGATVHLKGASSITCAADSAYISAAGCAGMARGGSGDILAGIMGALLSDPARKTSPALTAALAAEIHGLAGERAQMKYSERAMNALDEVEFLPEVFAL